MSADDNILKLSSLREELISLKDGIEIILNNISDLNSKLTRRRSKMRHQTQKEEKIVFFMPILIKDHRKTLLIIRFSPLGQGRLVGDRVLPAFQFYQRAQTIQPQ